MMTPEEMVNWLLTQVAERCSSPLTAGHLIEQRREELVQYLAPALERWKREPDKDQALRTAVQALKHVSSSLRVDRDKMTPDVMGSVKAAITKIAHVMPETDMHGFYRSDDFMKAKEPKDGR